MALPKWIWRSALCLFALAPSSVSAADDYVLWLEYETHTESLGEFGGRSTSSGQQGLVERVIGKSEDGIEIEYSIPGPAEEVRGTAMWMFPARIAVAPDGSKALLNEAELSARLADWLASAEWSREVCSRWLFTWTAVQIECNPHAVIEAVEMFGMRPGRIAEGEPVALIGAAGAATLKRTGSRDGRAVLSASADIDPQAVRDSEVETALMVAEIMGETLARETAVKETAGIDATGIVSIEFEVDQAGLVWKRVEKNELTVTGGEHGGEARQSLRTITRIPYDQWIERFGS
ncbi:hypothetical protein [Alteriqipengyuania sp. 357]